MIGQMVNPLKYEKIRENGEFLINCKQVVIRLEVPRQFKIGQMIHFVRKTRKSGNSTDYKQIMMLGTQDHNKDLLIDQYLCDWENDVSFLIDNEIMHLEAIYIEEFTDDTPNDFDKIQLNHFNFIELLGEGTYGQVYLVRHKQSCKLFALKMQEKKKIDTTDWATVSTVLKEQYVAFQLETNPFLLEYYASFTSQNHYNLLMEYAPYGSFFEILDFRFSEILTQQQVKLYFAQLVLCLEGLHQQNVIFHDLKGQNILIDIEGNLRFSDCGIVTQLQNKDDDCYSIAGTYTTMAPEITKQTHENDESHSFAADFYSLGVVLYQMIHFRDPLILDIDDKDLTFRQIQNDQVDIEQYIDEDLKKLIQGLLDKNPKTRISNFETIKNNPWLSEIDFQKVYRKEIKPNCIYDLYCKNLKGPISDIKMDSEDLQVQNDISREIQSIFNVMGQKGQQKLSKQSLQEYKQMELLPIRCEREANYIPLQNQGSNQQNNGKNNSNDQHQMDMNYDYNMINPNFFLKEKKEEHMKQQIKNKKIKLDEKLVSLQKDLFEIQKQSKEYGEKFLQNERIHKKPKKLFLKEFGQLQNKLKDRLERNYRKFLSQ